MIKKVGGRYVKVVRGVGLVCRWWGCGRNRGWGGRVVGVRC